MDERYYYVTMGNRFTVLDRERKDPYDLKGLASFDRGEDAELYTLILNESPTWVALRPGTFTHLLVDGVAVCGRTSVLEIPIRAGSTLLRGYSLADESCATCREYAFANELYRGLGQ